MLVETHKGLWKFPVAAPVRGRFSLRVLTGSAVTTEAVANIVLRGFEAGAIVAGVSNH